MFLAVELYDTSGGTIHDEINISKIVRLSHRNPRNVEEGIIIYMQNGDQLMSPEPLYKFAIRRDDCMERFSALILIASASEYAKMIKPPATRKRTTTKK
jgi:hypothetical protein